MESDGRDYFQVQTHVFSLAQSGDITPFCCPSNRSGFYQKYSVPLSQRPYLSSQSALDLQAYKAQADVVLAASANLNDTKKMIMEYFDFKVSSFTGGGSFINFALKQNWTSWKLATFLADDV
ncbi:hypothetical protein CEUSTIGMA_g13217.t1 [Chlamydomonas eustigma]|uniref:Uncharacterized protein n=1 Tax=Chlamydomonas eustigma TaxID=1157962 RepID=A0A250XS96_9CHLO|nr:hypothetical protein CEUSTIGMA_g13217.t1 [Chlamydomonas eustigma]|eukprot:GAX85802.1 hypothetical protein CEUSTIGMA_g13217.t1 [Chlamydomonas eustigma]